MSNPQINKYSEDISERKAAYAQTGTAPILATANLNNEVDSTNKTEPVVKNFSTYRYSDTFLEDVANRYKI